MGKSQFLFFINILLVLTKCSFLEEELALVHNFVKVWDFPDFLSCPAACVATRI